MKYCQKCGAEMEDAAEYCPKCGASGNMSGAQAAAPDVPSTGLNVLSFFFPIVGLILFLVWKETTPLRATAAGKWALIGFIAGIVGSFVVYGCSMASLYAMY